MMAKEASEARKSRLMMALDVRGRTRTGQRKGKQLHTK